MYCSTHTRACSGIELPAGNLHVYRWRVSWAAVSVGVQVVERAVELLVGGLQQGGGATAQRTWGAASQQSRRAAAQQPGWTSARQSGRVSTQEAVAVSSHRARGAAVHEAGGPQQRQGGLSQGSLQERETEDQHWELESEQDEGEKTKRA